MVASQIAFWFLYGVARPLLSVVLRVAFRIEVRGRSRVPRTGGLLVVSNHISHFDPPFLGFFLPRPVEWMAMIELFGSRWSAAFMRSLRAFPVDRTKGDSTALREAVRRLRAGRCVVMFPEGGIRVDEESAVHGSGMLKEGAAAIARIAHVPILPVLLEGTRAPYEWRNWFFRRPLIKIKFGKPFYLGKHSTRAEASEELLQRMQRLAGTEKR